LCQLVWTFCIEFNIADETSNGTRSWDFIFAAFGSVPNGMSVYVRRILKFIKSKVALFGHRFVRFWERKGGCSYDERKVYNKT
jgi:hypothetical protein